MNDLVCISSASRVSSAVYLLRRFRVPLSCASLVPAALVFRAWSSARHLHLAVSLRYQSIFASVSPLFSLARLAQGSVAHDTAHGAGLLAGFHVAHGATGVVEDHPRDRDARAYAPCFRLRSHDLRHDQGQETCLSERSVWAGTVV